ncbi:hypothetical protein Thermus77412_09430 [Thermus antranikianii]
MELRPEGAPSHQEPPLQEGHLHLPFHPLQELQEGLRGRATGGKLPSPTRASTSTPPELVDHTLVPSKLT